MKFIGGIQNFKIDNNSISIKLPYYHRVATGLVSGAEVYLLPKISTIKNATGQETQVREIIISPFHPIDWFNIYQMELIMNDKPGMINQITEILKEKNINIHIQESLITNEEQNFSVSLIVDTKDFRKRFKEADDIETSMKAELQDSFTRIEIQLEKFLPCKQLRNNSNDIQLKRKTNGVDDDTLNNFYTINYHPIQIIKKELIVGKQVIQALFQDTDSNTELQGTIFSDTDEKMIIIRFFNRDQHVVYFDVQHENKLGAIFHYSTLIKEVSISYNIISCYNRIENATETAHWYVLLDVSHDIDKLYTLFTKLSSTVKFTQKLIVHNYSRSIELLKLTNLYQYFPSQTNINAERHRKAKEAENEEKFQEAISQITKIESAFNSQITILKEDISVKQNEFKKVKKQFWAFSIVLVLVTSFLVSKIITPSDIDKIYLVVAGIAGGLLTIIHLLVVYIETPKLYEKILKPKNKTLDK